MRTDLKSKGGYPISLEFNKTEVSRIMSEISGVIAIQNAGVTNPSETTLSLQFPDYLLRNYLNSLDTQDTLEYFN